MKKRFLPPHKFSPQNLLLSWFGCGYVGRAPGTIGTLGALPCAWIIQTLTPPPTLVAASLGLFILGWWLAERHIAAARETDPNTADPQWIVLDEVAGMWLAISLFEPSWFSYAGGFLFFRLFDIWKPWPVGWADRNVKGGLGVMLDDYIAGLLAALLLYAATLVWWI